MVQLPEARRGVRLHARQCRVVQCHRVKLLLRPGKLCRHSGGKMWPLCRWCASASRLAVPHKWFVWRNVHVPDTAVLSAPSSPRGHVRQRLPRACRICNGHLYRNLSHGGGWQQRLNRLGARLSRHTRQRRVLCMLTFKLSASISAVSRSAWLLPTLKVPLPTTELRIGASW